MDEKPSVYIEPLENYPALLMYWQRAVAKEDVSRAFQTIHTSLDASEQSLYIVVDITESPRFPMLETISSAMRGVYGHPKLILWLVVGSNTMAETIERVLSHSTGKKKVEWFASQAAALSFIERHQSNS